MKISQLRPIAFPLVVAGSIIGALAAIWAGRNSFLGQATDPVKLLVGWICLLFLTATVATIIWACAADQKAGIVTSRRFLGYALLTDGCGLLLLVVGTTSGQLHMADVARVYVVLMTWLGLWISVAVTLRKGGPALAVVASLLLSMVIFAGPVTAVPLARIAANGAGNGAGERVVSVVTAATPMLAVLDAVKDSFQLEWAQLPRMYHLTAIGQDMPVTLPRWWVTTLCYAVAGGVFWLLRRPWREGKG